MSYILTPVQKKVSGITAANSAIIVPANHFVSDILVINNTANAVTGGLKFGTSSGAVDMIAALAVGANGLVNALDAALLKRFFSKTVDQTIFIDAVVAWNSANVDVIMWLLPA